MTTALMVLMFVSVALSGVTHACLWWLTRRRPRVPGSTPPVTILKPMKGVDDGLLDNLRSFAELDYPTFQLVLGVADPADPALRVARRFAQEYPELDIDIVVGAAPLGRNPKVENLASMSRVARHDTWLISDSNVRVRHTYLRDTVAELRPGVGLVTNLFAGVGEESLGATLENHQLSTWIAAGVAASQVVTNKACVVGKSMLFRRDVLDRLGGFDAFRDILAEDYVIGEQVEALGLRTVTSPHVIRTVNGSWTMQRFLNRHLRWAQIRRRLCPAAFVAEPLLNPTLWSVAAIGAGASWVGSFGLLWTIVVGGLMANRLRGEPLPWLAHAWAPIKDLMLVGIWLVGAFRRRVWWRGNVLWISRGSVLVESPVESPEAAVVGARP